MGIIKEIFKKYTREELFEIASNSKSKNDFARNLGYNGTSYTQCCRIANEILFSIPEFDPKNWLGQRSNLNNFDMSKFSNPSNCRTSDLKKALVFLRGHRCEECGLEEWNGKKITLETHHKDGNRKNNTLENIVLLCPNCHSFTDNWKNKNGTNIKKYSDEEILDAAKNSSNVYQVIDKLNMSIADTTYERITRIMKENNVNFKDGNTNNNISKNGKNEDKREYKNKYKCPNCGGYKAAKSSLCFNCYSQKRAEGKNNNSGGREYLLKLMRENDFNTSRVSRIYGVTDNCIKKWCVQYDIPHGKNSVTSAHINLSKYSFDELKAMYEENPNISALARKIGTTSDRIKTLFRKNNYDYKEINIQMINTNRYSSLAEGELLRVLKKHDYKIRETESEEGIPRRILIEKCKEFEINIDDLKKETKSKKSD